MFPAFAKLQEDRAAFRRTYFQALRYVSLLAFPVAVGYAGAGGVTSSP